MSVRSCGVLVGVLVIFAIAPAHLFANEGGDRVHFFQDITVDSGETAGSVVCLFCSIRVAGTSGDTVAILGDIIVDGAIDGDVVAVGGGIKLGEDATVSGDAVGIGRGLYRHPNAVVKGEMVSQTGSILFALIAVSIIVVPLLPIILVVSIIVWLLRRPRTAPPAPVAYRR